jgi:hypothetical protein
VDGQWRNAQLLGNLATRQPLQNQLHDLGLEA